jgi:glutamate-1-semialdehyde 2,1-aminomutase
MFQIYFTGNDVKNYNDAKTSDVDKFAIYFQELMKNGIFIPPSQFECCFLSQSHSREDLENTIHKIESSLKAAMK